MVVNFVRGNLTRVSLFQVLPFLARGATCTRNQRLCEACIAGIRVSGIIVRTAAKTSAVLRATLSNFRDNGVICRDIVPVATVVRIAVLVIVVRCNAAGCPIGVTVVLVTVTTSASSTTAFSQLQDV